VLHPNSEHSLVCGHTLYNYSTHGLRLDAYLSKDTTVATVVMAKIK